MSQLPTETFSLIQKLDGYSGKSESPTITDASLYLEDGTLPMQTPDDGQVLIKMRMASVNPLTAVAMVDIAQKAGDALRFQPVNATL